MKLEAVTIKDIARALNISKSTVSRALKNASDINEETKASVLAYAEKISYRPNHMAAGLKKGKSYCIGVMVSEIANNFFSQSIEGIEAMAYDKGYSVIISQSRESQEREIQNVEVLCAHSIDGLLISLSNATTDISYLTKWIEKGLPVVMFDKVSDEINTHKVKANNYIGAFKATEQLILKGYRRIAHITAPAFLSNTIERLDGYKAALEKYSIPFAEELVKYCSHGSEIATEAAEALRMLFALEAQPDAIFTASDRTTIACFQLLHTFQQKKPLGFAGFSNSPVFNSLAPAETIIVHQPAYEIGKLAGQLLFNTIESKSPISQFETKVLNTDVMVK